MFQREITIEKRAYNGKASDLNVGWLIQIYGRKWEKWREFASEWLHLQDSGVNHKLQSINLLFDIYFAKEHPWAYDVQTFFENSEKWLISNQSFKNAILEYTDRSDNRDTDRVVNYIAGFLDWVLDEYFSYIENGKKRLLFKNPFVKAKSKAYAYETVHNPLPYRYICDLRTILCPKVRGHFSDWKWAYEEVKSKTYWFNVDESLIDKKDPDCVWRKTKKGFQIWSPVAAVALFLKLHLPLRTYQVRFLDSGEADEMRYERGDWGKNTSCQFAIKGRRQGVFRRLIDNATGLTATGLYVNTNKTADQHKSAIDSGYIIPWENRDALYWLEKLRNWQEKYNPISEPTSCSTLELKHTSAKKSKVALQLMGDICFLMRHAASKKHTDRDKPIVDYLIFHLWFYLLKKLEDDLFKSGNKLLDNSKLKFVYDDPRRLKTHFPLHSLRVSLITSYIIDANVPLPVVSKLLAGHSRLVMTLYYTKITPTVMREKMDEAHARLEEKSERNLHVFLRDANMQQISNQTAYLNHNTIEQALVNRNPISWENRYYGLCLAGGNTSRSDESRTVAGCWNGGDLIHDTKDPTGRIYAPVAHGPENCVRCRWFITDATYLVALNSQINLYSYKAHESAHAAMKLEKEIDILDEEKYFAESEGKIFTKFSELQSLHRRHEKQLSEADEYVKDFLATFRLIKRLMEIERERTDDDSQHKYIAVGNEDDIKFSFIETTSELFQLSLLCRDAEVYPELADDLYKTPVIEKSVYSISKMMMKKGYEPKILMLNKEQQLIALNAIIRKMVSLSKSNNEIEGYQNVISYLELEKYMYDDVLFKSGLEALEDISKLSLETIDIKTLLK